ncbi:Eisosome component PIL1-domain-containing protein [Peziza echinospora]|nr:Eisosome component PIL1-domain-containing protein [Peziza echinospora]
MSNPPPAYTPRTTGPPRSNSISTAVGRQRPGQSKVRSVSTSAISTPRRGFLNFGSFKDGGNVQRKRLAKMIKSENNIIDAYETAGREMINVATQLSEWGEQTGDDSVSDLSDKLGVLLSEIGTQETLHAQALEESRAILKAIRNTEFSVQPSRDHKAHIQEEIARLKYKDPQSSRIMQLEQELVRAEAENLVAEAQLTNITRNKLKEAYKMHFAVVVERGEKQALLARQAWKMLQLLDDTPIVPGDRPAVYEREREARDILTDAENAIKDWRLENLEDIDEALVNPNLSKAGLPIMAPVARIPQTPAPRIYQTPVIPREHVHVIPTSTPENVNLEDVHPALRSQKEKGKAKAVSPPYPVEVQRDRRPALVV